MPRPEAITRGVRALVTPVLALVIAPLTLVAPGVPVASAWAAPAACPTVPDQGWPGEDLRAALAGPVRRLRRRSAGDGFDCRPLDPEAARAALAELGAAGARYRGRGARTGPVSGSAVGCIHACGPVGVQRLTVEALGHLVPRLLVLPVGSAAPSVTSTATAEDLALYAWRAGRRPRCPRRRRWPGSWPAPRG